MIDEAGPYLDALGIETAPFLSSIASEELYLDTAREQVLNQLQHLVQSSGLLLVVSAEAGAGKSTLLRQFLQRVGKSLKFCPIQADPDLSEQALLDRLADCLDLPQRIAKAAMLELLDEQAALLLRNDLHPLIVVDNAESLSDDSLNLLLQLQQRIQHNETLNETPWRIVLFIEADQVTRVIDLDANLHFVHLPLMDEQQLGKYLLHRLRSAGFRQSQPFSDRDIAFIHGQAQGNLNQVNQLAHQLLLKKFTGTPTTMKATKKDKPRFRIAFNVWISAGVVVVLSAVLFFQDRINSLVEGEDDGKLTQQTLELPPEQKPVQDSVAKQIPTPAFVDISPQPESPPASRSGTDDSEPGTTAVMTDTAAPEPVVETASSEPPDQTETGADTSTPPQAEPAAVNDTAAAVATETQPTAAPASPAQQVLNKAAVDTQAHQLAALLQRHAIHDRQWILRQPSAAFTAQLSASSKPDALLRLAQNQSVRGNTAIYHVLRKQQDWYVLVYGNQPDKESMRKAVEKLPVAIRKSGPWIRPFADVQTEIRRGHM